MLLTKIMFVLTFLFVYFPASAQKRIDLDDLTIKGELINDGRLSIRAREPAAIEDRVKYRKSYKQEIIETYDGRPRPVLEEDNQSEPTKVKP